MALRLFLLQKLRMGLGAVQVVAQRKKEKVMAAAVACI